jgi:hypothetical protein
MKHDRKLINMIIGAMALATVLTTNAYAQMGGGGMMGGFGSGGGFGTGMMGGNGMDSRNAIGYAPGRNEVPRDLSKIETQFHRIERLRRELLESSVDAHGRIAAQLNAQQGQRLRRIAPRWNAGE